MVLSTSLNGFTAGLIRAAKVIGWHVATNLVVAVTAYLANVHVSVDQGEKYLFLSAALMGVNALLAFIAKWLKSVSPEEVVPATVGDSIA
jgi:apolipoprotein N-acyltransferase